MSDTEARWLDPEAAARYLNMRADVFLRAVKSGKVPAPSYALGIRTPRWDRNAIDARMEGAAATSNVRAAVDGLAEEIAQGRKGRQAQAA